MVADPLSRIPLNWNQETTLKSTYQKEIISEIYDIKELPEYTFRRNIKLIQKFQWTEPSIKDKYKYGTYHKGYFCQGRNIDISLKMCKNNIVILSKLQSYVLHWYHTYLLHPGMDRTEAMIRQHLYCPDIRDSVHK